MAGNDNRLVLRESNDDSQNPHAISQPRQPRTMEDLLRYAIEVESMGGQNESSHDGVGPLDAERRDFLGNVISSMTVDLGKELKDAVSILQNQYNEGDDTTKFEEAFDCILDITDNIDLANDYCKLGGFEVCKNWLISGPSVVRWRAANVIGECCQNNPFCQDRAMESGLLKMCMDYAQNDSDETVRLKSFHAVSCIIRNHHYGLLNFLSLNGHKLILNCLGSSSSNRLKAKTLFLTSVIANEEGMLREQLWDIGFVNELVILISKSEETKLVEDVSCFEQCLSAFLCLVKGSKKKLKDESSFISSLVHLLKILGPQPAYKESVEYIKNIIDVIDTQKR